MFAARILNSADRLSPLQQAFSLGVLFQLVWFALVLGSPGLWVPAVLVYGCIYFAVYRGARYLSYLLFVAAIGIVVDYVMFTTQVFVFADGHFPLWLIVLWLVFASALPIAFGLLRHNYLLASIIGSTGGASSYFLAIRMRDDVNLGELGILAMGIVLICWAIMLPLFFFILNRREQQVVAVKRP